MPKENQNTRTELNKLLEDIREYIDASFDLMKVNTSEWIIDFFYPLLSSIVMLVLMAILLIFVSFAGAYYVGDLLCSIPLGFLSMGLMYLLFIVVFYALRKKFIMQPLAKFILKMFFHRRNTPKL